MNTKLYRDAILDAKALRETAIANAKEALNELFEPKIQQMLKTKLMEGLEEDSIEESQVEESLEVGQDMNESELDEILRELEALDEESAEGSLNEEEDETESEEGEEESEEDETESEEGEEESEESFDMEGEDAVGDDTKVVELTLGDLRSVIQDIMNQEATAPEAMPGDDLEAGELGMDDSDPLAGAAPDAGLEGGEEEELSLDEILAELDAEEELEESKEEVKEAKGKVPGYGKLGGKGTTGYDQKVGGKGTTGYDKHVKQLKEANSTIKFLKSKLNEVNLLNAKLLYVNKIFKAKPLNESQKVQVLKAFDKISTVKDAQKTYKTIMEGKLKPATKKIIKESVGFASKPAGVSPKPVIESDPQVERWMKLAGIKK